MTEPEISVIIPTLANPSLKDSLDSIPQKGFVVETIVVDGTQDREAEDLAREYQGSDGGPHEARELGTRVASGKFIQFLDDDDILYPQKFEKQVQLLESKEAGVAYCGFERNGHEELPGKSVYGNVLREALSISGLSTCSTSTMLIETQYVKDLIPFPNKHGADDTGMEIELAKHTEFEFVNEVLVRRGPPGRETSQTNIEGRKEILERYAPLYNEFSEEVRYQALSAYYLRKGVREIELSLWSASAIKSFGRSLWYSYQSGSPIIFNTLVLLTSLFGRPGWKFNRKVYILDVERGQTVAMNRNELSVAMLYFGDQPHPAHQGFAATIDADLIGLSEHYLNQLEGTIVGEVSKGISLPEYDVYIAEGTRSLYGALSKQPISDSILLYLAADHLPYELLSKKYDSPSQINSMISSHGIWALKRLFRHYIDGAITISPFIRQHLKSILGENIPIRIVSPYIQDDLYHQLLSLEPDLQGTTAVQIGANSYYKGQDLLISAWEDVIQEYPEAELRLVGTGNPKEFERVPGVSVLGYVENIVSELERSSLYVQPSRADGFGVSVVEAMLAGVPPVVTSTTGSSHVVKEIEHNLIAEPEPVDLAATIIKYFDRSKDNREILSESFQTRAREFNKANKTADFDTAFTEILELVLE
jgi:glycosyltransferase involved in cell wall biosynthesis